MLTFKRGIALIAALLLSASCADFRALLSRPSPRSLQENQLRDWVFGPEYAYGIDPCALSHGQSITLQTYVLRAGGGAVGRGSDRVVATVEKQNQIAEIQWSLGSLRLQCDDTQISLSGAVIWDKLLDRWMTRVYLSPIVTHRPTANCTRPSARHVHENVLVVVQCDVPEDNAELMIVYRVSNATGNTMLQLLGVRYFSQSLNANAAFEIIFNPPEVPKEKRLSERDGNAQERHA